MYVYYIFVNYLYIFVFLIVLYTIKFRKQGLPHAHIFVFLHFNDKNPTTADVDKIVLVEIPDKNVVPDSYHVVTEVMMHRLCGMANPKISCMVDRKCNKHYPKKFNK